MAELKRNFLGARMNKDVDERLLKPGEYRDANNIEVSTSEGSDVGTVQTIKGNTKRSTVANSGTYSIPDTATCVGSIASLNTDKIYYFLSAGDSNTSATGLDIKKDYIVEYDPVLETHKYVFVDIHEVKTSCTFSENEASPVSDFLYIPYIEDDQVPLGRNTTGVRLGMNLTSPDGYGFEDDIRVVNIKYTYTYYNSVFVKRWKISLNKNLTDHAIPLDGIVNFHADSRPLNFKKTRLITGINILDDSIYWTDNFSEPKKISISRSIAGTGGEYYLNGGGSYGWDHNSNNADDTTFKGDKDWFHTRLVKGEGTNLSIVTKSEGKKAVWVEEKHTAVIKKGPTQPLELTLYRSAAPRYDASDLLTPVSTWGFIPSLDLFPDSLNGSISPSGSVVEITFSDNKHFRIGDTLLLKRDAPGSSFTGAGSYDLRVRVLSNDDSSGPSEETGAQLTFRTKVLSINSGITINETSFKAALEQGGSITELVFPRFSYRYRYQDGEYSIFAPWSEVAFLASDFNFSPTDGFNFGMDNQLRSLEIKGYHAGEHRMGEDIVAIDILYKETNNPTVYTVKTVTASDDEWPGAAELDGPHISRGKITLTSNLVHTVIPSNQLLRPWDNVPREALAQEISANRLIYGNYLQGYTVDNKPTIISGYESMSLDGIGAAPSVKSLRDYTVGVTFSDGYGRETPIVALSDTPVKIPKDSSSTRNRLHAELGNNYNAPQWAKYFTYYVKETSSEYYNLIMDRWYSDDEDNIWISLPSSERNKLDDETFVVLKKASGTDTPVLSSSKYKVLDISNEAPDSIKTTRKSVGLVYDTTGDQIGNSVEGYPIEDTTFFTVQQSPVEVALGEGFTDSTIQNLTVRFSGEGQYSKYYEVSNVSQPSASGSSSVGKYYFRLATKFGADVGFATAYTGSFDSAIDNLSVEFFSSEAENKPEFNGRFFIKIKKDSELRTHIMGVYGGNDWVVEDSKPVAYINNNGYQGAGYPIPDAPQSIGFNIAGHDSDNRHLHPTEWDYHRDQGGDEATAYYWGNNGSDNTQGLNATKVKHDPIAALNDESEHAHAMNFWATFTTKQQFFIDAATAYSWASTNEDAADGSGNWFESTPYEWEDWLYNYPDTGGDQESFYNSIYGFNSFNTWAPAFGGTSGVAANMKSAYATPSRGIRDATASDGSLASIMDISWTGIGYGDVDQYDMVDGGIPHQLRNSTLDAHINAWAFIQKLVEPGTKFRFQDDPDAVIYTVRDYTHTDEGYNNSDIWKTGSDKYSGAFGIRNYRPGEDDDFNSPLYQFQPHNMRQRWSLVVVPRIGSGLSGYNPISGTKPAAGVEEQGGPAYAHASYRRALHHDGTNNDVIEIIKPFNEYAGGFVDAPGVFETQPKEGPELDIYYQASGLIPFELDDKVNEEYLPLGTTFEIQRGAESNSTHTITEWLDKETIAFTPHLPADLAVYTTQPNYYPSGALVTFTKRNNYSLTAKTKDTIAFNTALDEDAWYVNSVQQVGSLTTLRLSGAWKGQGGNRKLSSQVQYLDWSNCWVFGNGVESDRIRDDYNAAHMDNGVKASSTITTQVKEERRKHGLIWSGIYNSTSGVNDTNQFIMAEKITKDLNPVYGSIQKLYNRDTRLIMFCEDKILRGVTNKDALYNADGNPQLVASNKVIGDTTPYQGDFGISTNPESFVATPYQMYFTDAVRGQVLRMTSEGVVSISDKGMRNYFADLMASNVWKALGTYDERKKEYNLSLLKRYLPTQIGYNADTATVSYSESAKGWTSVKSFIPQNGLSINNKYFTFYNGHIWEHYTNDLYNDFYGTPYTSDVTAILNEAPGSVKSFNSISYEGSQARTTNFATESAQMFNNNYASTDGGDLLGLSAAADVVDGEYFNLTNKDGWYVDNITTDQQTCGNIEFKEKEGKWFGYPSGETTSLDNLDEKEFTVQGLGTASISHSSSGDGEQITITIGGDHPASHGNAPDGDAIWDETED